MAFEETTIQDETLTKIIPIIRVIVKAAIHSQKLILANL